MSDSGNHPPLEELAAYIDGMLSEEEAARVAEHIAECEDCFFVYSETVRFQLEHPEEAEEPGPDDGKVVPFSGKANAGETQRRRRLPWWVGLATAAMLAVAVGIPLYLSLAPPRSMPEMTTAELLAPVQGAPDLRGELYDFKRTRGEQEDSEFDRQSFMVGVFLTDLRLALETGDAAGAAERLQRIHVILDKIGGMDEEMSLLRQEENRMRASSDPQVFLPKLEQWEKEAGDSEEALWVVDPDYVTFGKWVEAGRVAAVLQKEEFFRSRENRRVLSYVLRSKEMAPDEDVVAQLQEIESLWKKDDLQSQDFTTLAKKFEAILEAYDTLG